MADNNSNQTKNETATNVKDKKLSEKQTVTIHKQVSPNWISNIEQIKKEAQYRERNLDKTLKNNNGSISTKKDGSIDLSSGRASHIQLSPEGIAAYSAPYEGTKTNIYSIDTHDVIVNNHKLNNKLYELADFKKVLDGYDTTPKIVGGLTMLGTVLVKVWEPNLKRYVLARRLINIPMFSPSIGGFEVPPGIKITPATNVIQEMISKLDTTGISTYAQLSTVLEEKRKAAILNQEQATTEANQKIIEENAKKQVTSMTTLTGQDPTQFGSSTINSITQNFNISPSTVSAQAAVKGDEQKQRENTDNRTGWDEANGRPVSTTAIWYKVKCGAHKFYVMQGHDILKTYDCNTSHKGTTSNKVSGDNKTLLGVFTLSTPVKNDMVNGDKRDSGCKLPNTAGTFGSYWIALSCGFEIGIHGDYPSEDAKKILTKDAPATREPEPGEGSTHGCIRLYNKDVEEVATKYAEMKSGQYIKIEA